MALRSKIKDLEQPLLAAGNENGGVPEAAVQRDTFWPCAINLAKAVTGAGMMAIPRAYQQIGSLLGTAMLVGVALLTYFTLAVLIYGSARTGAVTYSQLVSTTCGRFATKVLQLSVLTFCFGFSVVYLVVIRDILLGSLPACSGLLCELFGLDPTGLFANPELVIAAVALFVCAPLLLMRSMDSLAFLNAVGVAAVALLAAVAAFLGAQAVFTGTAHPIPLYPQWQTLGPTKAVQLEALADVLPVILACYVAHQNLHPLMPLLTPYTPGKMCGVVAVALSIAGSVFATLAVGLALTFGPGLEVNVLNNFSEDDLKPLLGQTLAEAVSWITRGAYLISILGSLLLYMHPLRSILAEVLWGCDAPGFDQSLTAKIAGVDSKDFDDTTAADGPGYKSSTDHGESSVHSGCSEIASSADAAVVVAAPAIGPSSYSESMVAGNTTNAVAAVVVSSECRAVGSPLAQQNASTGGSVVKSDNQQGTIVQQRWQQLEQRWCYTLTYSLLLAMVLVAILVPSIWSALSAIGDLASTTQAFMIPGCIALSLMVQYGLRDSNTSYSRSRELHHEDVAQCSVDFNGLTQGSSDRHDDDVLVMKPIACAHYGSEMHLNSAYQPTCGSLFHCNGSGKQHAGISAAVKDSSRQQLLQLPSTAPAAGVVYVIAAAFVVLLGVALFMNGVWQRV